MLSTIGALLVLAICLGVNQGNFTPVDFARLIGFLVIYTLVVLFGLDRLGRAFFRRSQNDRGSQFLFVLLAVFVASMGADLIGVDSLTLGASTRPLLENLNCSIIWLGEL